MLAMLLKLVSKYSVYKKQRQQLLQQKLHTAVAQRKTRTAQQLLDAGARADQRSFSSTDLFETPLLAALIGSDTAMAHVLLEAPSTDINSRISCAHNPLQFSAMAGDLSMVQTLLTHGAKPNVATNAAPVPLALATSTEVIVELLRYGANFGSFTGSEVTRIICMVMLAVPETKDLTLAEAQHLLRAAAGWQWDVERSLTDAAFCKGFYERKLPADSNFGAAYREWDVSPYEKYLKLPAAEQKLINVNSACPWQGSGVLTQAYKYDRSPHSGNAVQEDVTMVLCIAAALLVGCAVYFLSRFVSIHVAKYKVACRVAERVNDMAEHAYDDRAAALACRERADDAIRAAARATQRAQRSEARAAAVHTERNGAVTERNAAVAELGTVRKEREAVYEQLRKLVGVVRLGTWLVDLFTSGKRGVVVSEAAAMRVAADRCIRDADIALSRN
jgi:hypothetical protein